MKRKVLIVIAHVGIILGSVQLVINVFSDTLDGGVLAIFSITTGLALAVVFYLISGKFNFPILVFFSVFFSTLIIAYTNQRFASTELMPEMFFISSVGNKFIRKDRFYYIELTNGTESTKYNIDRDGTRKYSVGDPLILSTKKGYWGFTIIGGLDDFSF